MALYIEGVIKSKVINTNSEFKKDFKECVGREPTLDEIVKFQDGKNALRKEGEDGLSFTF